MRQCVSAFTTAIAKSLKVDCIKQTVKRVPFRFNVFRFLFGDCKKKNLYFTDFDPQYFSEGWNQCSSRFSTNSDDTEFDYWGRTIVFPLKVSCELHWSPTGFIRTRNGQYVPKARTPLEYLRVQIVKERY